MDAIFGNLDLWREGITYTLLVFFGGGVIALVLGTIVGAMRVSPVPIARAVGTAYVTLVRNTPYSRWSSSFFVFGYSALALPTLSNTVLGILAIGVCTRPRTSRGDSACGHQYRARRPGRSRACHRSALRTGDDPGGASAGVPPLS